MACTRTARGVRGKVLSRFQASRLLPTSKGKRRVGEGKGESFGGLERVQKAARRRSPLSTFLFLHPPLEISNHPTPPQANPTHPHPNTNATMANIKLFTFITMMVLALVVGLATVTVQASPAELDTVSPQLPDRSRRLPR